MKRIITLLGILFFLTTFYALSQNESEEYYAQMFESIRSDFEQNQMLPQVTSVSYPSGPDRIRKVKELRGKEGVHDYIMIIVDEMTYNNVKFYIERYADDINTVTGKNITLYTIYNASPVKVKEMLSQNSVNIFGAVFIGDVPTAYYEIRREFMQKNSYVSFPCDLYYMDLNGEWKDSDHNGIFETNGDDPKPEIFVGRISTKNIDSGYAKLRKYFDKNHKYWTNINCFNGKYSLGYIDKDWASPNSNLLGSVDDIFAPGKIRADYTIFGVDPEFGQENFLYKIGLDKYDYVVLACHSSPSYHAMTGGGFSSQIVANKKIRSTFFNLFSCSACNWERSTVSSPYLGGAYVYSDKSETLTLLGSTKTGSMLRFWHFNPQIGQGKSVGESLKEWWLQACGSSHEDWEVSWFYGLTIVGDPLLFIPQKFDLMIKDNSEDLGIEPNTTTKISWNSPDIWVRNQNDDVIDEHQEPIYYPDGQPNYIYVRIHNNSKYTSNPNDILIVRAYKNSNAHQAVFFTQAIVGTIPPFKSKVLKLPWVVSTPSSEMEKNTYLLTAEIKSDTDVLTYPQTFQFRENIYLNNNNMASKKVSVLNIVPKEQGGNGYDVQLYFGNIPELSNCSLEFIEDQSDSVGSSIAEAEITLSLDESLLHAWKQNGQESIGVINPKANSDILQITQNHAMIKNIPFSPNENNTIRLQFNFLAKKMTDNDRYVYHVVIRDSETNDILDGQTIVINKENDYTVHSSFSLNDFDNLVLVADEIEKPASYNWYDESMNLLAADTLSLECAQNAGKYILEVVSKETGFKDYMEMSVAPLSQIVSISPNPATDQIKISFRNPMEKGACIRILSAQGIIMDTMLFDQEYASITKDISAYPASDYTIVLWDSKGNKVGYKLFVKK